MEEENKERDGGHSKKKERSLDGKRLSKAVRSFVRPDQLLTREANLLIVPSLCVSKHSRVKRVFFGFFF